MGRIILTIAGPWSKAPDLNSDFETHFGGSDDEFAEDFIFVARRADAINADDARLLRAHEGILKAAIDFDHEPRRWAERGVQLALDAIEAGAVGVFVETACKAFTPHALKSMNPKDAHSLFHFYVEVLGDGARISTEGMYAFDLPEVTALYGASDLATAQAAVFSLAAQMVCNRFVPVDAGVFRASESAPLYVARGVVPDSGDDPYQNPLAPWVLTLSD